jgi:CheY-like chemotaxis protein
LLNNAAKYTKRDGRIWLTAARKGKEAVIKIRDNGIGISAEILPQIFEMFAQADRAKYGSAGGLGIGLTLVKRLVEMHGGTISAHSEGPDKGSEFIVRLPLASSQLMQKPLRSRREKQIKPAAAKPLRILVVDDNLDSADSLGLLMKLLGNEVEIVHDGLAAVAAAYEFKPRVVLLDIGLPGLNGYEAAKMIRQQPSGKLAILIAVTGWGEDIDRQRSKAAGFDHHLVKPLDPDLLTSLLEQL